MSEPTNDPSIEHEPHLQGGFKAIDPSEAKADKLLQRDARRATEHDAVEHSVWNEPVLSVDLAGEPEPGELTYSNWLTKNIAATTDSPNKSVGVGPWLIASGQVLI